MDDILKCPVCGESVVGGVRGCAAIVGAEYWVRTAGEEPVRRVPRLWFCSHECKERHLRASAGEEPEPLPGDLLEEGFSMVHAAEAADERPAAK